MEVGTHALDVMAHSSSTFLLVSSPPSPAPSPRTSSGELPTPVIKPADSTPGTAVRSLVAIVVPVLTLLEPLGMPDHLWDPPHCLHHLLRFSPAVPFGVDISRLTVQLCLQRIHLATLTAPDATRHPLRQIRHSA
jgi:hypothetical protein